MVALTWLGMVKNDSFDDGSSGGKKGAKWRISYE